jgi:hypothetical protein
MWLFLFFSIYFKIKRPQVAAWWKATQLFWDVGDGEGKSVNSTYNFTVNHSG